MMDAGLGQSAPGRAMRPEAAAGRRIEAVGQQAKAAVTEARAEGADLPRGAQGLAASGIARGVAPESLFAARVTPMPGRGATEAPSVSPPERAPVAAAETMAAASPPSEDLVETIFGDDAEESG